MGEWKGGRGGREEDSDGWKRRWDKIRLGEEGKRNGGVTRMLFFADSSIQLYKGWVVVYNYKVKEPN